MWKYVHYTAKLYHDPANFFPVVVWHASPENLGQNPRLPALLAGDFQKLRLEIHSARD
jgi:hypothetical protein